MFNTCVIEHKPAAWAVASAKVFVSSCLQSPSFPQGALLNWSCAVSVTVLCLATVCFHISPCLRFRDSDVRTFLRISVDAMRLRSQVLVSKETLDLFSACQFNDKFRNQLSSSLNYTDSSKVLKLTDCRVNIKNYPEASIIKRGGIFISSNDVFIFEN